MYKPVHYKISVNRFFTDLSWSSEVKNVYNLLFVELWCGVYVYKFYHYYTLHVYQQIYIVQCVYTIQKMYACKNGYTFLVYYPCFACIQFFMLFDYHKYIQTNVYIEGTLYTLFLTSCICIGKAA